MIWLLHNSVEMPGNYGHTNAASNTAVSVSEEAHRWLDGSSTGLGWAGWAAGWPIFYFNW